MPIYRVILTWNLLSDDMVGYGLSRFKSLISSNKSLFSRFCSCFDSRVGSGLTAYMNL